MTARTDAPTTARGRAGSGMFDGFILCALAAHGLLAATLLFAPTPPTASGLEGGKPGGGNQMMELALGGPGARRASPRPPEAKAAATPLRTQETKPDAKAVSARKRDTERQPKPVERKAPQPAAVAAPNASRQPDPVEDVHDSPGVPSGLGELGELEGTAPGSGGTDKGVAFGAGGGTGGGTSGTSGAGAAVARADAPEDGGDYDRKARPLYAPQPPYPAEARRKKIEGTVVVRLRIDAQGRVASGSIVGGEATDLFAEATLATVERWRFRPCGRDGRDVACEVQVPVVFKLVK